MRNNRIDCTVIDKKKKKVVLLEMSCPWVSNGEIKCAEKTSKYAPLRYELRRRYPGHKIEQHNIIIDALGGSSRSVKESLRQLFGIEVADVIQCSGTCRKLWSLAPLTLPGPSRSCRTKSSDDISSKHSFNRFIGHSFLF